MKSRALMLALSLGSLGPVVPAAQAADSLVYIGTRGPAPTAEAPQGIYAARLDVASGKLTPLGLQSTIYRTAWMEMHPSRQVLFTVVNPGAVATAESNFHSFAVDRATGGLRQIGQAGTGGIDTTHLAFDARSNTLFGASFVSGAVTAVETLPDGSLGKLVSTQKHTGSGPHPRQASPHAHAAAIDPSGRYLLSADMGADRVFVHRFDPKSRALTPADPPFDAAPPGTGPRHLVFHPNGRFVYVNTELTAEVRAYRWDARRGRLQLIEALPAYPAGYAGNAKSSAEIGIAHNGRTLYVSLRGDQNSMVVYAVNGRTGKLTEIQRIDSQGRSPRSFGIDPSGRWMLVMNELSNSVNVFGIDRRTGKLSPTRESMPATTPAMVAFLAD
jgi:6-phosphogluconolactonase